jgi:hypothetical protein
VDGWILAAAIPNAPGLGARLLWPNTIRTVSHFSMRCWNRGARLKARDPRPLASYVKNPDPRTIPAPAV